MREKSAPSLQGAVEITQDSPGREECPITTRCGGDVEVKGDGLSNTGSPGREERPITTRCGGDVEVKGDGLT